MPNRILFSNIEIRLRELGLKPRAYSEYIKFNCPNCNTPDAYIFSSSSWLRCSHLNSCAWKESIWKYLGLQKNKPEVIVPDSFSLKKRELEAIFADSSNLDEFEYEIEFPQLGKLNDSQVDYLDRRLSRFGDLSEYILTYDIKSWSFTGRILFPVSKNFFVARSVDEKEKKRYLNAKARKINSIFGLEQFIASGNKKMIITEGVFSALSFGVANAVALLGKKCLDAQLDSLLRIQNQLDEFIVILDRDAKKESLRLIRELPQDKTSFCLLSKKDPNEYSSCELAEILERRKSATLGNIVTSFI